MSRDCNRFAHLAGFVLKPPCHCPIRRKQCIKLWFDYDLAVHVDEAPLFIPAYKYQSIVNAMAHFIPFRLNNIASKTVYIAKLSVRFYQCYVVTKWKCAFPLRLMHNPAGLCVRITKTPGAGDDAQVGMVEIIPKQVAQGNLIVFIIKCLQNAAFHYSVVCALQKFVINYIRRFTHVRPSQYLLFYIASSSFHLRTIS